MERTDEDLKKEFKCGSFITTTFEKSNSINKCIGWVRKAYGYKNHGVDCYFMVNTTNGYYSEDGVLGLLHNIGCAKKSTQDEIMELMCAIQSHGDGLKIDSVLADVSYIDNAEKAYNAVMAINMTDDSMRLLIEKLKNTLYEEE